MLKSMYSGISGMKANQTKMDVVGNNVANVGTTAFKKSSVRFSDALNQTIIYSSSPGANVGGVNPGQVGIGTKVAGIAKYMTQGAIQPTGRPTDLAIDGEGFFVIQMDKNNAVIVEGYTRDGSFSLDANGNLVTAEGYRVLNTNDEPVTIPKEYGKSPADMKKVLSFNISREGNLTYLLEDGTKVENLQTLKVAVFQNESGLEAMNSNIYSATANSGNPLYNTGDTPAKIGLVTQGAIEMSNIDLSEEFTDMIVATRAFQAAGKVITTSDELLQEILNLKR